MLLWGVVAAGKVAELVVELGVWVAQDESTLVAKIAAEI